MTVERLTLANGDWIDLQPRLNYAQARRIRESKDNAGTTLAVMAVGWALRDVDDQAIPFPERTVEGVPLEALSAIPFDVFAEIIDYAADLLTGQPDPKDTAGTSPASAPARPSRSRRTSRTPTSSPTIQDGATPTSNPPPLM